MRKYKALIKKIEYKVENFEIFLGEDLKNLIFSGIIEIRNFDEKEQQILIKDFKILEIDETLKMYKKILEEAIKKSINAINDCGVSDCLVIYFDKDKFCKEINKNKKIVEIIDCNEVYEDEEEGIINYYEIIFSPKKYNYICNDYYIDFDEDELKHIPNIFTEIDNINICLNIEEITIVEGSYSETFPDIKNVKIKEIELKGKLNNKSIDVSKYFNIKELEKELISNIEAYLSEDFNFDKEDLEKNIEFYLSDNICLKDFLIKDNNEKTNR